MNEKAKQNYATNRQQQSTQKLFRDFLKNNQDLPNQKAPTTYVSPHRNNYHNQSRSPHTTRYHTSPYRRPREQSFSPHRHNSRVRTNSENRSRQPMSHSPNRYTDTATSSKTN